MNGGAAEPSARGITVPYRVRFDESAPGGSARASVLLAHAQDAAWVHSERLGFGREWYAERGLTWLVRAVELALLVAVPTGTELAVTTEVVGFRRVMARRRTTLVGPDGILAAHAVTDWVIVDAAGRPARVPEEFPRRFGGAPVFEPIRVPPPPPDDGAAETARTAVAVRPRDLDPVGHVNNAVHVDYLEETVAGLPDGIARLAALPRTYRLEYLLPASPGRDLTGEARPLETGGPGGLVAGYRLMSAGGAELVRGMLAG